MAKIHIPQSVQSSPSLEHAVSRGDKVQSRCALSGSAHRTVSLQRQMLVKQVVQKAVEDGCHDRVVDIPVV